MKYSLKNKIVLVVGGTSGIGLEIVKGFSEEGASVITCGRSSDKATRAFSQFKNREKIHFIRCDIGIKSDIEELFRSIREKYCKLDIAVNNASIFCMGKSIHEYTFEKYNEVINVNLTGTFLCMQEEVKLMFDANNGAIVNIISTAGIGAQTYGSAPYIISKHGEVGLTKVAALEYAKNGIRVNAVLPGMTNTELLRRIVNEEILNDIIEKYPMKRLIEPTEVAEATLFLSSDAASGINGLLLTIDQGKTVRT